MPRDATSTTSKRRRAAEPTLATAAATLGSRLAAEGTPLSKPEPALMQQWLTTLAGTQARSTAEPHSMSLGGIPSVGGCLGGIPSVGGCLGGIPSVGGLLQ
jgi:hypothetical protein